MTTHTHSLLSLSACGRKHRENQDRALARVISWEPTPLYLIAVADGISSCPYGASVARYIVERHLQTDVIFQHNGTPVGDQLRVYLTALHKGFHDEFADMEDMQASGASLSVAVLSGDTADCLWVGDSPIYISRKMSGGYATEMIMRPDKNGNALTDHFGGAAPFALKHEHLQLSPGDILTLTSDGAVHDAELLSSAYAHHGFTTAVLNEVRDRAFRSPICDDTSVAACQRRE